MKNLVVIVIFATLTWSWVGCDERPYELWIDDACSPGDQKIIKEAVGTLNNWTRQETGEALIELAGADTVDHDKALEAGADPNCGRDFVVCFNEKPKSNTEKWVGLDGFAYQNGDIWLFRFGLSDREFALAALHEIGHYVGLGDLIAPGAVMDPIDTGEVFTEADREELCRNHDCRGES